jgi:hypothetical protein
MQQRDRGREAAALQVLCSFARPESPLGDSGLAHNSGGAAEALLGAGPGARGLDVPIARRGRRHELAEQPPRRRSDLLDGPREGSFACDGFCEPLTLRTYWSAAAWTSSSVAGGSKLWSVLMFRHMGLA